VRVQAAAQAGMARAAAAESSGMTKWCLWDAATPVHVGAENAVESPGRLTECYAARMHRHRHEHWDRHRHRQRHLRPLLVVRAAVGDIGCS
jgi:hypothetical protein